MENDEVSMQAPEEPVRRRRGRPPMKSKLEAMDASQQMPILPPDPPAFSAPPAPAVPAPPVPPAGNEAPAAPVEGTEGGWQPRRYFKYNRRYGRQQFNNDQQQPQEGQEGESQEGQTPEQHTENGNYRQFQNYRQNYRQNRYQRYNNTEQQPATTTEGEGEPQDSTPQQEYFQNKRQRRFNQQGQAGGFDGMRQSRNDKNNQRRQRRKDFRDNNEHKNPKIGDVRDIDHYTDAERNRIEEAVVTNPKIIKYNDLEDMNLEQLCKLAESLELTDIDTRFRHDVLLEIVNKYALDPSNAVIVTGVLQVAQEGYGFIRTLNHSYTPHIDDVYITQLLIRRLGLRTGDLIVGQLRHPRDTENFFTLMKIITLNDAPPDAETNRHLTPFENLIPFFPTQRLMMERQRENDNDLSARIIDLVTPIGRGQRGLIVAGPRTGKTVIMQKIANSILANDPDIELIILLIDERPEEVTDMKRVVAAEVVSSTFDQSPERHAQVAEMVIEKAKRRVEHGHHVVIMLDSITRLARAYNTLQPHSGRILSGGVDANALQKPKRFFGAARNIEGGGSLTILATALVDTGSKMDEVIFEEFKGTGNMELHLDSKLVDRRIYPAIDIEASGTRREELIVHPDELERLWLLRRAYCSYDSVEAMTDLLKHLKKCNTNAEFLMSIKKPPEGADE